VRRKESLNQTYTKLLETSKVQLISSSEQNANVAKVRNAVRKLDVHKIIYSRVMQKYPEG